MVSPVGVRARVERRLPIGSSRAILASMDMAKVKSRMIVLKAAGLPHCCRVLDMAPSGVDETIGRSSLQIHFDPSELIPDAFEDWLMHSQVRMAIFLLVPDGPRSPRYQGAPDACSCSRFLEAANQRSPMPRGVSLLRMAWAGETAVCQA